MLTLLLTVLIRCAFDPSMSSFHYQNQDLATINSFIARQARRERGEEYEDARKVMAGDLNGDGVPETVVLYTIESQGGSNNYIQYLAVFARRGGHLVAVTHTAVGGKSRRSVDLSSVNNRRVNLETLLYAPKDASCCPSLKATTSYVLRGGKLREHKAHLQSTNSIIKLGAFSNMRYTAEHAYGYKAELWREQNRIFGFFLSSQGLMGDTPTGLLEDVRYDPRTGELTFQARLTTGLFSNRQFNMVPSRDVFRFKGVLKGRHLIGTLAIANALTPTEVPRRDQIRLTLSQKESEVMIEAQSYADWREKAEEILKFRGPKW